MQIASVMIMSRLLLPDDFGVIAAASIVSAVATVLSDIGFGSVVIRKRNLTEKFLGNVILVNGLTSFIINGLILLLWLIVHGLEFLNLLSIFIAASVVSGLSSPFRGLLQRKFYYGFIGISSVSSYFLGLIIVAPALALLGIGPFSMAYGQLSQAILLFFLFWLRLRPRVTWTWRRRRSTAIFSYGLPVMIGRLLDMLLAEMDKLILPGLVGMGKLGAFERSHRLPLIASRHAGTIIDAVLFPYAISNRDIAFTMRFAGLMSLLASLGFIVLSIWVYPIVLIILGSKYVAYAPVVLLMILVGYLRVEARIIDIVLRSIDEQRSSAYARILPNIMLAILLINFHDGSLKVWALIFLTCSMTLNLSLTWSCIRKNHQTSKELLRRMFFYSPITLIIMYILGSKSVSNKSFLISFIYTFAVILPIAGLGWRLRRKFT